MALCHFDRDSLKEFADELWLNDIKRLVVLRGDGPLDSDNNLDAVGSVAEGIRILKKRHGFDISVAAYPEIHPKAGSLNADLDALVAKQDAGADRAITQYFFTNEDFYRFRDLAAKHGFRKEIVPGIIPIANFEKIKEFSAKCGASVPAHFEDMFAMAGDDKAKQTEVARAIVEGQVRDLAQHGVRSLHVYSLNRVDLTADAIRAFNAQFSGEVGGSRSAIAV